ncbi:MAG: M14 family zinc carboxypeptidase, partial [Bacteroidota bacterium]
MNKTVILTVLYLCLGSFSFAQRVDLSYYLPDQNYNPAVPTPESFLGYQVGEWHVGHDQLVAYMYELARVSDRISIREYARSYERRPLVLLTITSPNNHSNIENIKRQHRALSDPTQSANLNTDEMPAIIYQGYTIHGNEASGANAALLYAYHLAAAQGPAVEAMLQQVVVLLDPTYNPDGMNRFASWVNVHKSKNGSPDPADREFNEAFPRGRTNHYWFDLNRDWLPAQHPESQGRIRNFHEWYPLILTDHHEMGTNNTFFFQPGIPSRTNPLTPQENQDLTEKIGGFHAKALDKIGSLYYSKESFDDFYYGKGSTYPDVNGSIGILFEQASS